MRHPQGPLEALRADMAANPSNEAIERWGGTWLVVAQALHRLSDLSPHARRPYAERLLRVWAQSDALGAEIPDELVPALADAMRLGDRTDPSAAVERFLRALGQFVEAMERAGAFHLAFTTLGLGRRAFPQASARAQGMALVQQARVTRQLGDLATAAEMYDLIDRLGRDAGDAEVRGRAANGQGNLANMRGNYPEAREAFHRTLAFAREAPALAIFAHHGLMVGAIAARDVETALVHGWRAFAGTVGDAERRADLLTNLGEVARMAHAPAVAMTCYLASLRLTRLDRIRLAALGGAVLAAVDLRDFDQLDVLTRDAEAAIVRSNQPYENAFTLVELAEAHAGAGRAPAALAYAARAAALAAAGGFHEVAHRVEMVRARLDTGPARIAASRASRHQAPAEHRVVCSLTDAAEDVLGRLAELPRDAAALVALEV